MHTDINTYITCIHRNVQYTHECIKIYHKSTCQRKCTKTNLNVEHFHHLWHAVCLSPAPCDQEFESDLFEQVLKTRKLYLEECQQVLYLIESQLFLSSFQQSWSSCPQGDLQAPTVSGTMRSHNKKTVQTAYACIVANGKISIEEHDWNFDFILCIWFDSNVQGPMTFEVSTLESHIKWYSKIWSKVNNRSYQYICQYSIIFDHPSWWIYITNKTNRNTCYMFP